MFFKLCSEDSAASLKKVGRSVVVGGGGRGGFSLWRKLRDRTGQTLWEGPADFPVVAVQIRKSTCAANAYRRVPGE